LEVTPNEINTTLPTVSITVQGTAETFNQSSTDLTLKSGYTMVMYIKHPDSVALNDVGTTVGITVFSANAQYYKEINVQAAQ
jgi:hypothetical protein